MFLCIVVITPDQVDLWEAIATFLMFPLLVYIAYKQDVKGYTCMGEAGSANQPEPRFRLAIEKVIPRDDVPMLDSAVVQRKIKEKGTVTNEELLSMAKAQNANKPKPKKSYLMYRIDAVRGAQGKKRVIQEEAPPQEEQLDEIPEIEDEETK